MENPIKANIKKEFFMVKENQYFLMERLMMENSKMVSILAKVN